MQSAALFARILLTLLSTALSLSGPCYGQSVPTRSVDLELVLAVDTSGSVNETRFQLQRKGYAEAFRDVQVLKAIRSGPSQAIAVTMIQWTGPSMHVQVVPWTLVGDEMSARGFADAVEAAPRALFRGGTSISGAIDEAVHLFQSNPYKGARRVIDISGDGSNNAGRAVTNARDDAVAAGIGINGLPITAIEPGLDEYYRDSVIGGPGAFVIPVATFDVFGEAIRRKLIIEISAATSGSRFASDRTRQASSERVTLVRCDARDPRLACRR